ncbi:hypothetical protein, partial [Mycolicibacterium poriferae]|uniref:hypothetical protein n=1 Tax=Mycolicibacterium poriferae TaxID=39694 RepID=UPI0024B9C57C
MHPERTLHDVEIQVLASLMIERDIGDLEEAVPDQDKVQRAKVQDHPGLWPIAHLSHDQDADASE